MVVLDPANTDIRHVWEEEVKTERKTSASQSKVAAGFEALIISDICHSKNVKYF